MFSLFSHRWWYRASIPLAIDNLNHHPTGRSALRYCFTADVWILMMDQRRSNVGSPLSDDSIIYCRSGPEITPPFHLALFISLPSYHSPPILISFNEPDLCGTVKYYDKINRVVAKLILNCHRLAHKKTNINKDYGLYKLGKGQRLR